jgi:hypothetical protein
MRQLAGEGTKTVRKSLADRELRVLVGTAIDGAMKDVGLLKQEAAFRAGYGTNQSPVTRWTGGTDNQPLAKLWALGPEFQAALVVRLARLCGARLKVQTLITVPEPVRDEAAS